MLRTAESAFSCPVTPARSEHWQPAPFAVDPWLVLRLSGYRRREAVTPPIREAAERMTARADALAEPRAVLQVAGVAASGPDGVRLTDGPRFSGGAVRALLEGCPHAVAFVLTLGPRLEAEAGARAERREPLESFLLDTAGWAAIETAVRRLRLDLMARARAAGWRVTHRLAPGYRDWPLEEQRALLSFLDDAGGLVRLTEHGVLAPFKSVTGLFGLRPGDGTRR